MPDIPMFHEGSRRLQSRHGTTALADRIVDRLARKSFDDRCREFIQAASMFFLATADADGNPDCSYKGGTPGFVQILDDASLAFPSYDGNGMYKSLGNILVNPSVGLLFIDFERPGRLRVNGHASIDDRDPLLSAFDGAEVIVRVRATAIFPNCPRYVHQASSLKLSEYAPRPHYTVPEPEWKQRPEFRDVLPAKPCQQD